MKARRKPFYLGMVDTDRFLQLPVSTQTLYFMLGMYSDDDSVVSSPEQIVDKVHATKDDLHLLIDRGFAEHTDVGVRVILNDKSAGGAARG